MAERTDPRFYRFRNVVHANPQEAERLLREDPSLLSIRNAVGETVLHWFVIEDQLPAVEWLLQRGADLNTRDHFGGTPLISAVQLGYGDMVRFLLARGADPRVKDEDGGTALSVAAEMDNMEMVHVLLAHLGQIENVNDFFPPLDAYSLLQRGGPVADVMRSLGLESPPWEETAEDEEGN